MNAKQLVKLMAAKGWYFEREGKGSHMIYKHKDYPYPLSIPFHGSKDLGKGLLQKILKQAGIK
jgi:predicted RNA binding protein YcfA (HicA-like mRNA interferase family)